MIELVAVVVEAETQELAERAVQVLNDWLCNSGEQDFYSTQDMLAEYGRGEEVMSDYNFLGRFTNEGSGRSRIYKFTIKPMEE